MINLDYINRYVYAVGKHLPSQQREDIKKEIHTLIMDMVDERKERVGSEKEAIQEVLLELGDPAQFAAQYHGKPNYVIGPSLIHSFIFVFKISMLGIGIGLAVAFFAEAFFAETFTTSDQNIVQLLIQYVGQFINAGLYTFGVVTAIFILIERYGPSFKETESKGWDPSQLNPVPKHNEKLNYTEIILTLLFTIGAIIFFNFYLFDFSGSVLTALSLERLQDYLVYWNIVWAASIVICLYSLVAGRYTLTSRFIDALISVASFVIFLFMVQDPSLLSLDKDSWIRSLKVALNITLISMGISAVVDLYKWGRAFKEKKQV